MGRNSAHILVACVAALVGLGLTMLASVGAFSPDNRGQTLYFLQRQGLWLAVGTGICVGLSRCDAKTLLRFAGWIFGLATLLVAISLVPGLGKSVKGSARWIPLGPFAVQPGEMLKLATVLLAALWSLRALFLLTFLFLRSQHFCSLSRSSFQHLRYV
jgi:cell division protein FtsW